MWWLLGLLGLLFLGWGVASARALLNPPRAFPPAATPLPAHATASLTAPDGTHFTAWIFRTPSPRARVLLCHGYYANRTQVLGLVEPLRAQRWEVVLFELRGHGDRPGPCTLGFKEADDADTLLAWAAARDAPAPLPVGVLGWSMGAAVAIQVAMRRPEVKAVVADSPYARLFPVLQQAIWRQHHLPGVPWAWLTWWTAQAFLRTRLSSWDPARLAGRAHQPLLYLRGGEDRRVPLRDGRELYERWAGPKEQWVEPGVGHVSLFARTPEAYCHRVTDFFNRSLAQ